ncbi:hypothetical protein CEXT_164371, partial [Caerostris extrusa]
KSVRSDEFGGIGEPHCEDLRKVIANAFEMMS